MSPLDASAARPSGLPAAPGPGRMPWAAVVWPLAVAAAAALGAWGSQSAPVFYAQLDKPAWAPPAAVFGPVWGVLYLLMALAAFWVARRPEPARRTALAVFGAQLVANALWSWCFFAWHSGAGALAVLVLLWLLLLACVRLFWPIHPRAAALMAPVLAWVSFAGALNLAVWWRNPGLLG